MKSEKLNLPLSETHKLRRWANSIRGFYGHPVYLVGSQLTDKPNPRDVDVVCIIPDEQFALRFGDHKKWEEEGASGMWTDIRWKWSDECVKRFEEASKETELYVDFKIIPQSDHNRYSIKNEKYPPYRLDTRN